MTQEKKTLHQKEKQQGKWEYTNKRTTNGMSMDTSYTMG